MSNKNTLSRDQKANTPKNRPERVPFGQGSKLAIADRHVRKGYHAHLFLDKPGELEGARAAWYEFVLDENGKKITMPAGKGLTHYLMEIDQETYDEDMRKQQDLNDKKTQAINEVKPGEYSPGGKSSAITRDMV